MGFIPSLRAAITANGGTPTQWTAVGLLRELITAYHGTPTKFSINELLREAVTAAGGTPVTYDRASLLRALLTALSVTPASFRPDALATQLETATLGPSFDPALNLIPNGTFTNATGVTLNTVAGNTPTISGGLLHFTGRGAASEVLSQPTVIGGSYQFAVDVGPNQDDFPLVTVGGVSVDLASGTQTGTNPINIVQTFTATAASTAFVIGGVAGSNIDADNLVLNRTA